MGARDSASSVLSIKVEAQQKGKSIVTGILLVCLLLVLLFGGLGLAVSPMFFLLVVVLIVAFGWGGFYRRGR